MAGDPVLLPSRVPLDLQADPLARLRDIRLPEPVPFWPPAPGWLLLAAVVLALVLAGLVLEWRRRRTLAYRVLREFEVATRDPDIRAVAASASVLMRRVLLTKTANAPAAAFTGAAFARFVSAGPQGVPPEIGDFLALAPYLPPDAPLAGTIDRAALIDAVRRWIRSHAR